MEPTQKPCGRCGATDAVRRYQDGMRCAPCSPAAALGLPVPEPGPGWPSLRGGEGK